MIEKELQRLHPGFSSMIIDSPYEQKSLALRAAFRDQSCLDLHLNLSLGWVASVALSANGQLQPVHERLVSALGVKRTASSHTIARAYYDLYSKTWHQLEELDHRLTESGESNELALVRAVEAEFHKLVPPANTTVLVNIYDEGYMLRVALQQSLWVDFYISYVAETNSGNWVMVAGLDPEQAPIERKSYDLLDIGATSRIEDVAETLRRMYSAWWDIVADAIKTAE